MKKLIFVLLAIAVCVTAAAAPKAKKRIKVACVGNSITFGLTLADPETQSYPSQLAEMLGAEYEVDNFGKSGATLLNRGHRPYMQQEEFKKALEFAGDIAVIHLGINDTDPRDWPNYRDEFIGDYCALVDSLRKVNNSCRVLIARMTPISHRHFRFESGTRDWHDEIQEEIALVAKKVGAQLIDFYEPLLPYPNFFSDQVHPNIDGARVLAQTVYGAITGNYGGLAMPEVYGDGMVLQHGRVMSISGTANAGDKVTVKIAGQEQNATTDTNGKWSVNLMPLTAGGPYTLTVSTNDKTLEYKDVLAGEVWLCSGQSNMEFTLDRTDTAQADIAAAKNDNLRLFNLKEYWRTDQFKWSESALDSVNHLIYFRPAHWAKCTPETAAKFSAVAYHFGKVLQDSLKVPVGLICNAVGGSPIEAWIPRPAVEHEFPQILHNWTKNDFGQEWVRERGIFNCQNSSNPLQRHPYEPCFLFESSVRHLTSFPIKGVIWYQGESNAHNKDAHTRLFTIFANSWRKAWGYEFPIYFVQLSSINRPSWPWFRDSQRRLLDIVPNSGMAVCHDWGHRTDVHPRHKSAVGERLAYWALNKSYAHNVVPSGPLYKSVEYSGGAAYVKFEYGKGMHAASGNEITTFEIADEFGIYHPAKASVVDDCTLKVWSSEVDAPTAVRYGWTPYTEANLVNGANLPASTFTTRER